MGQGHSQRGGMAVVSYRTLDIPARGAYRLVQVQGHDEERVVLEAYRHIQRQLGVDRIREIMAKRSNRVYAVLDDREEWAGLIWLAEGDGSYGIPVGFVYLIAVRRNHRGQGIGRWLMNVADTWAKDQGYHAIELNVDGNNDIARRLYRSHGYEEVRVRMRRVVR